MRIAVVSDVHGNRTAFEAILADLRETTPDLILHGGDLPHGGSSPAEIVDLIRDLGWNGVLGNTDEMLFKPETLTAAASQSPVMQSLLSIIQEMAEATREALGEDRLEWLRNLPVRQVRSPLALVHASPTSLWRSPGPESADVELESSYGPLCQPITVYGHIHHCFVRHVSDLTVVNAGSVSLSYDGDPRASYLLLDGREPTIRRVEYDLDREIDALRASKLPHADWIARMLRGARFEMP